MTIKKWVEFSQEVDVHIDAEDIRGTLAEAFADATKICRNQAGEERPNRQTVITALNGIGAFLNAMTDDMIAAMLPNQREIVSQFLLKAATRFTLTEMK
jgi:predicted YcjX-like family ATPase